MLTRVRRLEAVRAPLLSPFETAYGSLDAFEAHCRSGLGQGVYDRADIVLVIASVRRWHMDGAWAR